MPFLAFFNYQKQRLNMKLKKDINGILFDMDGVLVDSMKYHVKSFEEAMKNEGLEIEPKEIYEREGEGSEIIISDILDEENIKVTEEKVENLVRKKRDFFEKIEETKIFPGMEKMLRKLRREYKLGLVSGSNRENVQKFVRKYFKGVFDYVITEDDVLNQKPSPEPYLKCLRHLNLKKEEGIVIENAPLGVRSAKNAGLLCVAIATYLPEESLSEADFVLKNHEEFKKWIRKGFL